MIYLTIILTQHNTLVIKLLMDLHRYSANFFSPVVGSLGCTGSESRVSDCPYTLSSSSFINQLAVMCGGTRYSQGSEWVGVEWVGVRGWGKWYCVCVCGGRTSVITFVSCQIL